MIGGASVLVVDDHQLVSTSLALALRGQGVAATSCLVTAVQDILAEAARHRPGLVLLDLMLGVDAGEPINSVDAIPLLRTLGWSVLVVSGSGNRRQLAAAMAAGAEGAVLKSAPIGELLQAVHDVFAGRPPVSAYARRAWLELDQRYTAEAARRERRLGVLSAREREVLGRLAMGHRASVIADEFVVSLATVRSQIRSILAKLDVGSQLEAVALVRAQNGMTLAGPGPAKRRARLP